MTPSWNTLHVSLNRKYNDQTEACVRSFDFRETKYIAIAAIPMRSRVSLLDLYLPLWCNHRSISDYKDDGTNILLDANENAYGPGLDLSGDSHLSNGVVDSHPPSSKLQVDFLGLNRYPDPYESLLIGCCNC